MSDAVRWERVQQVFQAVLDRPPSERSAFLSVVCGSDDDLRTEVASLLDADERAGSFAERPAFLESDVSAVVGLMEQMLQPGDQLGPYQIAEWLGGGGMGEVYRARDTRLGRIVAIKTLHRSFCNDRDLQERFEREARTLATLSHPHICPVFDVGQQDGVDFLVMEYLDGQTLAELLAKGPLPLKEALTIARQIADAVEAAHEKGIVHRDLKPANIKVRADGTVKVLDFGLAKALDLEVGRSDVAQSPAGRSPAGTGVGIILGTAAYMSPEQARGNAADRRSDIFAFGCVLYEMLTGRRAFEGDSLSEILARVIEREPDWKALPPALPPRIHELLRRCVEKDPKKRRRDIGDVRVEIEQALSEPAQIDAPRVDAPSHHGTRLAWIVAGVLSVSVAVAIARPYFSRPAEVLETRLDVSTPEMPDPGGFAISPDGRRVAFVAVLSGQPQLYLRELDADTARPLSGTDAATLPFWSPDGRSIGFFASGQLKRINVDGGLVQTLANASPGFGGTWGPDGVIVFAPGGGGQMVRVPDSGGEPVAVTRVSDGQSSHRIPWFLPGGRQFLFYADGTEDVRGIYLGSIDSPDTTRITVADSPAAYLAPGWLLFVRQGALIARRFDVARRQLSGESVTVAESVWVGTMHGAFSVATTGAIAYRTGGNTPRQLTWFNRSGKTLARLGEANRDGQLSVALSPDGQRAAVQRSGIWLIDSVRTTKFISDESGSAWAHWSPDGTRIAYLSFKTASGAIYQKHLSGAGTAEELLPAAGLLCDWSPNGRFLLYLPYPVNPKTRADLWVLPLDGDRRPFLFVGTSAIEQWGQFSPDGRWVAYQSDESGRFETYVNAFPGPGGHWLVSTSGGVQPLWSRDGKELYYLAPDGKLMAASVAAKGATLDVGMPAALFQTRVVGGGRWVVNHNQQYGVAPDGRFLINIETESTSPPITLVLNWKHKP